MEAVEIERRQSLLKQARGYRAAWRHVWTLVTPAITVTYVVFPSGRPWVLLFGVLALVGLNESFNRRLDAVTDLLEADLKRAANRSENDDVEHVEHSER